MRGRAVKRGEEHDVDAVGLQGRCRGRARIHADRGDIVRLVAGEADVPIGNRADHALLGKFLEPVDRVDDVEVEGESRAVEIRTPVTEHEIACFAGTNR